ncbi:MAG: MarR family transcriptional regulator [Deltaproteobacteria bacterium]|nr:MarR family transcriptional regulator [Deltaproteobacteria bacterium]
MNPGAEATNDPIVQVEELAQELMRQLDLLSGSKIQEDISYGQYKVISVIHNQGPISVGNLGRLVGSAQSTTSEMVARLTKSGLVTKVRGPYDGRVVMVELTDQGRQLMRRRRKRVREAYQILFNKLSQSEQDSFTSSLRKLNDLLAKAED